MLNCLVWVSDTIWILLYSVRDLYKPRTQKGARNVGFRAIFCSRVFVSPMSVSESTHVK